MGLNYCIDSGFARAVRFENCHNDQINHGSQVIMALYFSVSKNFSFCKFSSDFTMFLPEGLIIHSFSFLRTRKPAGRSYRMTNVLKGIPRLTRSYWRTA